MTKAFLPHFRENKEVLFINISSVGGKIPLPYLCLYHSTKWAVEGFTESLGFELSHLGIKAKIVELGEVATDFAGRSLDMTSPETIEDYNESFAAFQETISSTMQPSEPIVISKVIYEAPTDGKDQLRYVAGETGCTHVTPNEIGFTNEFAAYDDSFMPSLRKLAKPRKVSS
ncbi:hypothetical protein CHI06_25040 [Bacillus sp. 7884-1]|nr:hypothetical protein CHI06_25040 [Bacillus sp. 7884-1]